MSKAKHITKTAGIISLFTLCSRLFGYVRDGLGGALLGAGLANDAYLAAFRIPNLLRDLFAEGALSSAFVPTLTQARVQSGQAYAWRLTSIVINTLLLVLAILILLAQWQTAALVHLIVPGFDAVPLKMELTIILTRILLPFLMFVSLAAVAMGALNAHDRFGVAAFAPVMMNITMILFGFFVCPLLGSTPESQVIGWAWGSMLGGGMQLAIQIPAVWKLGFRWQPIINWRDPGFRRLMTLMLPAILGLSVTQINIFINTIIASFLEQGAVTYLYYGNRLMQLPLGVFGVAIATALLPHASRYLAMGDKDHFITTLSFGLRLMMVIILPCAVGLIILAVPINRLLFEYGRFSGEAVRAVAQASIYYTLGLAAFAGVKIVVPAFYALQKPKIPVLAAVVAVLVNITLNLLLMGPFGYRGLAMATSLAACVNLAVLLVFLHRAVGRLDARRIFNTSWRVVLAAAGMGVLIHAGSVGWGLDSAHLQRWDLIVKTFMLILTGGCAYLAFAWFFQVPEQRALLDMLRSKFKREKLNNTWIDS